MCDETCFIKFMGYLLQHKKTRSDAKKTLIFQKDMFKDQDAGMLNQFIADMCGRGGPMDTMALSCNFHFQGTRLQSRSFTVFHGPQGTHIGKDAAELVRVYYIKKAKEAALVAANHKRKQQEQQQLDTQHQSTNSKATLILQQKILELEHENNLLLQYKEQQQEQHQQSTTTPAMNANTTDEESPIATTTNKRRVSLDKASDKNKRRAVIALNRILDEQDFSEADKAVIARSNLSVQDRHVLETQDALLRNKSPTGGVSQYQGQTFE